MSHTENGFCFVSEIQKVLNFSYIYSGPATELTPPTSSSPTATNSNSMQSAALLAHKARKGSLEAVVGKLHCKTAPASSNSSTTSNPYLASDLYDDESEPVSKPPEVMLLSFSLEFY